MAVIYWVTAIYRAVLYRFDSHCSLKNTERARSKFGIQAKRGSRFAVLKVRMAGYRKQPRENVSLGITELSKNLGRDDGIEKPYFACVSNHKLMIGTGRYDQSPHDKRL